MKVGILTGTGTYALPEFEAAERREVETPFGAVEVTAGGLAGQEVLHVSRHGEGHRRLSSSVNHRGNVWALKELGAECAIGATVCGAVDPAVPLGGLIVFDDFHFPVNRLGDGTLCTLYPEPGDPERGHWIFHAPFSAGVREALLAGVREAGLTARDGGCYGHVDGPRFNTRTEIAALATVGVTAVSQTAGAEATLAGEAELPYALIGYATDYANGVQAEPTPVEELVRLMGESTQTFAAVLTAALPRLDASAVRPAGEVFRFEKR